MRLTDVVRDFLAAQRATHNHPALLDLYLGQQGMEAQVNVAQDDGEPIYETGPGGKPGRQVGYTDGITVWTPRRLDSEAKDYSNFSLADHAESIGLTGRDYAENVSRFVAADIDSLIGHKVGLTAEQLAEVLTVLETCPYVMVVRSTSGNGYHVYVFFAEPVPTNSRKEHAELARFVFMTLAKQLGIDLQASIDVYGGNTWICSRRATAENHGYELVQPAWDDFSVPDDWREQLAAMPVPPGAKRGAGQRSDYAGKPATIYDAYNADPRITLEEILAKAAWTDVGGGLWRRPGTDKPHSASMSVTDDGHTLLHVFTTGAPPLEQGQTYTAASLLCQLRFGGDWKKTTEQIREWGYCATAPDDDFTPIEPEQSGDDDEDDLIRDAHGSVISDEQLLAPGFIGEFAKWHGMARVGGCLGLGALIAWSVMSLLVGRKIRLSDGTRPNIVLLTIGPSGSGKSEAIFAAKDFFRSLGLTDLITRVGSAQGAEDKLFERSNDPRLLLVFDEFQDFARDAESGDPIKLGILKDAKEIYSEARNYRVRRSLAIPRKHRKSVGFVEVEDENTPDIVDQPYVVFLFFATSSSCLTHGIVTTGLAARGFLHRHLPPLRSKGNSEQTRNELFGQLCRVGRYWEAMKVDTENGRVCPVTIQLAAEAQELSDRMDDTWRREARKAAEDENYADSSSLLRNSELALKLSLILAASEVAPPPQWDGEAVAAVEALAGLVVEKRHVEKALGIVKTLHAIKMESIDEGGGDPRLRELADRVVRHVKNHTAKHKKGYLTLREIGRYAHSDSKVIQTVLHWVTGPGGPLEPVKKEDGSDSVVGYRPRKAK